MTSPDPLAAVRSDLTAALARIDDLLAGAQTESDASDSSLIDLPRTKAIEAVLSANGTAMRPVEIWKALQDAGRTDPKMEVQVTTFDLCKRGRIGKLGRGIYIALGEPAPADLPVDITRLQTMIQEIQQLRTRRCDVKSNANPAYLALSNVVTNLRLAASLLGETA